MALVKCSECSRDVSTFADKCPNCGAPQTKPIDKGSGISVWVIAGGVVFALVGVGHEINSGKGSTSASTATTSSEIVGSANATSSANPPDSFRDIKWDSVLPSTTRLHATVMKGCGTIVRKTEIKTTAPCSHMHIDTDNIELFSQKENVPPFLGVPVTAQMFTWSEKKFWSGEVFTKNDADYATFRQKLTAEYGPPTFENPSLRIMKWKWLVQGKKIAIQLYLDDHHNVSLLFTRED